MSSQNPCVQPSHSPSLSQPLPNIQPSHFLMFNQKNVPLFIPAISLYSTQKIPNIHASHFPIFYTTISQSSVQIFLIFYAKMSLPSVQPFPIFNQIHFLSSTQSFPHLDPQFSTKHLKQTAAHCFARARHQSLIISQIIYVVSDLTRYDVSHVESSSSSTVVVVTHHNTGTDYHCIVF